MGAIVLLSVCALAGTQFGDIVVNVDKQGTGDRTHGYTEYRFSVTNLSVNTRHRVKLILPQESYPGGGLHQVTRSAVVEPSSTVTLTLFAPMPVVGNGLRAEIDDEAQRDPVPVVLTQPGWMGQPRILISRSASSLAFPSWAGDSLKDKEGKPLFTTIPSDQAVSSWSDNWLAYSSYDGIVVTAEEMTGMPAATRSALIAYSECGGTLFVAGPWEVPEPWRKFKVDASEVSNYFCGFGQIVVSITRELKALKPQHWSLLQNSWNQTGQPWNVTRYGPNDANRIFPVVDNDTVPVRGLFLLMLLFVVMIGPVNLILLSRKKRRIWLLWTVPAISLVTCLAISAYAILSEGWKGRGRSLGITVLDETTHRATTIGWLAYYTPLTPGNGLHFSYETEVGIRILPYYYSNDGAYRTVDWTTDQHLDSGWISARRPAHFMIRRSESRRERLSLIIDGGTPSVVNGFGVPIRELLVATKDGRVYQAQDIPVGVATPLRLTPTQSNEADVAVLRDVFASEWVEVPSSANNTRWVRPGTYYAVLDGSPFIEEGLKGVETLARENLVFGILKESPDEN
ncbi:MAG TPA: hypothetical protein VFV34_26650 [Blastocatellia bacterium]|nr:hypothetical protein [Blastocatellia bacterium]